MGSVRAATPYPLLELLKEGNKLYSTRNRLLIVDNVVLKKGDTVLIHDGVYTVENPGSLYTEIVLKETNMNIPGTYIFIEEGYQYIHSNFVYVGGKWLQMVVF